MVAEPTTATYSDAAISAFLVRHPLIDELGAEPYSWNTLTDPPTATDNDAWVPTFDLNAAAADVWEEKAAALAGNVDFQADGGSFSLSQKFDQARKMARHYRARRSMKTATLFLYPKVEA
jgi:hypothetical protein